MQGKRSVGHIAGKALVLCLVVILTSSTRTSAGPMLEGWSLSALHNNLVHRASFSMNASGVVHRPYQTLSGEADWSPYAVKTSPSLKVALSNGADVDFLIVLVEQADLSHVAALGTKEAKGRAVFDTLRAVARRAQAPLRAELDTLGVPYRSFYIVNMLAVRGDASLAQILAARPDVDRLEANPAVLIEPPVSESDPGLRPDEATSIEWGVERIRAHDAWALGYVGQGIVIAGQDTGYEWDHPALKAQYRGWDGAVADHDYNWHDAIHADDAHTSPGNPCGFDSPVPCDDDDHGTHTMGTMVGDDGAGNQIGVAPGARWMGCRNMEQGWGTPATYAECFEFFLAPYPVGGSPMSDGDPSRAPHVINNSWSCPSSEGCDVTSLRAVVENVRAAGISVVVSAGNSGNRCGTVNAPPALHDAAFTIGATYGDDEIAGFSSRGPVIVDGSNRPKPDVSAPGVGVRSSVPGGDYAYKSGTSMAAPHVSGLVALLWSAAPRMIGDVGLTEKLIQDAARLVIDTSCGSDTDGHPNNVYGWGIVDALATLEGNLAISADAKPRWVDAGGVVSYTFTVENRGVLGPTTNVVLSDTLPLNTVFARASGPYDRTGSEISWSLGTISPTQQVSVTLVVTVADSVAKGTYIVNASYSVRSSEVITPVTGPPAVAVVPWRFFLPVTVRP